MIKHTVPATNRQDNRSVTLEVVTDTGDKHVELRLEGSLKPIANGALSLALDNETARALARSILETVPASRRR